MKTIQKHKIQDHALAEAEARGTATGEVWIDRTGNEWPVYCVPEDHKPKLVKFGRGRTTIDFGTWREDSGGSSSSRSEGYDDPEDFFAPSRWWAHSWAERRDTVQFEGVPFVDMRDAVGTPEGYAMVIKGPMVNVDLAPGTVDRLGEPSPLMVGAMQGNAYGAMLNLHAVQWAAGSIGSLDSVDVETWLAMWRKAGAKVGHIRSGQFVED